MFLGCFYWISFAYETIVCMFVCLFWGDGLFYDIDLTDCKGLCIITFFGGGSTKNIWGKRSLEYTRCQKWTSSGIRREIITYHLYHVASSVSDDCSVVYSGTVDRLGRALIVAETKDSKESFCMEEMARVLACYHRITRQVTVAIRALK